MLQDRNRLGVVLAGMADSGTDSMLAGTLLRIPTLGQTRLWLTPLTREQTQEQTLRWLGTYKEPLGNRRDTCQGNLLWSGSGSGWVSVLVLGCEDSSLKGVSHY